FQLTRDNSLPVKNLVETTSALSGRPYLGLFHPLLPHPHPLCYRLHSPPRGEIARPQILFFRRTDVAKEPLPPSIAMHAYNYPTNQSR
ncbi:17035_t:CDS:1, partial [Acaulospora colombiana]